MYRIRDDGQSYVVEKRYESKTLGNVQWIFVAEFVELSEAKRCYPTAEVMPEGL